jgi:hypothetical protein
MTGEENTPNNYGLQLVEVADFYNTPRHRHNFEQIRFMLDGSFGFGPEQVQEKGTVGYFCEGTYYTQIAEGRSTMLLLQLGGPTAQGFMSRRQVRGSQEEMTAKGAIFEAGICTTYDETGKKHNQDSYEAVWEYVHGRTIAYPKPQYDAPVVFRPDRFKWYAVAGSTDVFTRNYGVFNEKGLVIAGQRLKAGAESVIEGCDREQLFFCLEGEGSVDASTGYRQWTSIALAPGESATLHAESDSEFFIVKIPDYATQ